MPSGPGDWQCRRWLLRVRWFELRNVESTVAADCIRNEYILHRQIHQWLANGAANAGLDAFNNTVYSQLFLTPRSDPWLGLAPPDAYSAT